MVYLAILVVVYGLGDKTETMMFQFPTLRHCYAALATGRLIYGIKQMPVVDSITAMCIPNDRKL